MKYLFVLMLWSVPALASPALKAPVSVTANAGPDGAVEIRWKDTNAGKAGYAIERRRDLEPGFEPVVRMGPGASVYMDSGLAPGTRFFYRARAFVRRKDGYRFSAYSAPEVEVLTPLTAEP